LSLCVSSFSPVLELCIRPHLQIPDATTTPDLTAARTHTLTRAGQELGFGASRTGTLGARVSRASRAETLQLLKTVRSSHRTILMGFRVSRRVLKGFRVSTRGRVEAQGRGWLLELSLP
jgi:hypothetical protein